MFWLGCSGEGPWSISNNVHSFETHDPYLDFEWKAMSFYFYTWENSNIHAKAVNPNQVSSLEAK